MCLRLFRTQLQRESTKRGYAARAKEKQIKVGMGLMCEVEKVLQVSGSGADVGWMEGGGWVQGRQLKGTGQRGGWHGSRVQGGEGA